MALRYRRERIPQPVARLRYCQSRARIEPGRKVFVATTLWLHRENGRDRVRQPACRGFAPVFRESGKSLLLCARLAGLGEASLRLWLLLTSYAPSVVTIGIKGHRV